MLLEDIAQDFEEACALLNEEAQWPVEVSWDISNGRRYLHLGQLTGSLM